MSRINSILSIGDRVLLVKLDFFLDTPELPASEASEATERLEGRTGTVIAIAIPGDGINEQPRYVDIQMDWGEKVEAISIYHIRRLIGSPEYSMLLGDVEDEDMWFHLTHSMDFGG